MPKPFCACCIRDMELHVVNENIFDVNGISTQDNSSNSEGLYGVSFFYNIPYIFLCLRRRYKHKLKMN